MANGDNNWECVNCKEKSRINCSGCGAELCGEEECSNTHIKESCSMGL